MQVGELQVRLLGAADAVFQYALEWPGNYETDLKADALLMLILQQDANLASPMVGAQGGSLAPAPAASLQRDLGGAAGYRDGLQVPGADDRGRNERAGPGSPGGAGGWLWRTIIA